MAFSGPDGVAVGEGGGLGLLAGFAGAAGALQAARMTVNGSQRNLDGSTDSSSPSLLRMTWEPPKQKRRAFQLAFLDRSD